MIGLNFKPMYVPNLSPAQERRYWDKRADQPTGDDHKDDPAGGAGVEVVDGLGDAEVPVEGDEADIGDGGRAEHHVHLGVDGAPEGAKHPVAQQLREQQVLNMLKITVVAETNFSWLALDQRLTSLIGHSASD